jgi:hypothetical protein
MLQKNMFSQWSQQILSYAEAYNCGGALLGTINDPVSTDVLDPAVDADKPAIAKSKASSVAMCFFTQFC